MPKSTATSRSASKKRGNSKKKVTLKTPKKTIQKEKKILASNAPAKVKLNKLIKVNHSSNQYTTKAQPHYNYLASSRKGFNGLSAH